MGQTYALFLTQNHEKLKKTYVWDDITNDYDNHFICISPLSFFTNIFESFFQHLPYWNCRMMIIAQYYIFLPFLCPNSILRWAVKLFFADLILQPIVLIWKPPTLHIIILRGILKNCVRNPVKVTPKIWLLLRHISGTFRPTYFLHSCTLLQRLFPHKWSNVIVIFVDLFSFSFSSFWSFQGKKRVVWSGNYIFPHIFISCLAYNREKYIYEDLLYLLNLYVLSWVYSLHLRFTPDCASLQGSDSAWLQQLGKSRNCRSTTNVANPFRLSQFILPLYRSGFFSS